MASNFCIPRIMVIFAVQIPMPRILLISSIIALLVMRLQTLQVQAFRHQPGGVPDRMEDHFSPHNCRHFFTTHLRRAGMRREFIQELRGDSRKEAIDIYDHIDLKELKEAYLACIPQLGICPK
jgi:integrase